MISMKAIIPSRFQGSKHRESQKEDISDSSAASFEDMDVSSKEFTSGDFSMEDFVECSICHTSKKPTDFPRIMKSMKKNKNKSPECRFCGLLKKRGILCMNRDVVGAAEETSSSTSSSSPTRVLNTSLRNLMTRKNSSSSCDQPSPSSFVAPVNGQFI